MFKVFQHTVFTRLITTVVFGLVLYYLLKTLFFESILDKNTFTMVIFIYCLFSTLSLAVFYLILDVWFKKVIIYPNRIILKSVFKQKEILTDNIKNFNIEGGNAFIYSKDESIILAFSGSLKNDEKLISYLSKEFNYFDEEE